MKRRCNGGIVRFVRLATALLSLLALDKPPDELLKVRRPRAMMAIEEALNDWRCALMREAGARDAFLG